MHTRNPFQGKSLCYSKLSRKQNEYENQRKHFNELFVMFSFHFPPLPLNPNMPFPIKEVIQHLGKEKHFNLSNDPQN